MNSTGLSTQRSCAHGVHIETTRECNRTVATVDTAATGKSSMKPEGVRDLQWPSYPATAPSHRFLSGRQFRT